MMAPSGRPSSVVAAAGMVPERSPPLLWIAGSFSPQPCQPYRKHIVTIVYLVIFFFPGVKLTVDAHSLIQEPELVSTQMRHIPSLMPTAAY